MRYIVVVAALIAPFVTVPGSHARAAVTSGYTVTRTHAGIRLTLHFAQRSYPRRALVAVTARLTNLSRPGLYVDAPRPTSADDSCGGFDFVYAARSNGNNAQPVQSILPPPGGCGFDLPVPFPVGQSVVQRECIVLWTGRIYAMAGAYLHQGRSWVAGPGIAQAPTAALHLFAAHAPVITVNRVTGTATVVRPPGVEGRVYYREWGICGNSESAFPGWTEATRATITAPCTPTQKWHIDAALLNHPVATVNLVAG